VLRRWPRLVAHLICESLGYFTPRGAANAIIAYREGVPFACEWYCYLAEGRGDRFATDALLEVNRYVLTTAIRRRAQHRGYMADYDRAIALVRRELETGRGPIFSSW
jgi:hypothetical protein